MRTADSTTIEVPVVLRDRLARLKAHGRQAYHEVVEAALDFYEDALLPKPGPGRPNSFS